MKVARHKRTTSSEKTEEENKMASKKEVEKT